MTENTIFQLGSHFKHAIVMRSIPESVYTIFLFVILCLMASKAYAYDDGDFQVWNTQMQDLKINKDVKITLEEEFHLGDDASEFYYQHYDFGFLYNLRNYLTIGSGYRYVFELKKGKFKQENQPYVSATLFCDLKGFKFEDRSRMEYREFKYQHDSWRYHNKFTIKLPWKFTKIEIQPYLSDEIYISFGENSQLNQNKFSPGFNMSFNKHIKAELYYMLQGSKSQGRWTHNNILGSKLKYSF